MINAEKYKGEDMSELRAELADKLCDINYCPYMRGEGPHGPGSTCEGDYCNMAFEEWLASEA